MATMNISLPDTLRDFVKDRVNDEDYSTPSDYVRTLIRADRQRKAAEEQRQLKLEALRQAINKGISDIEAGRIKDLEDVVVQVKQRGRERFAQENK
ncbi:MAG: type II toxin-antitoxin system ParD family antitoxin [Gammaproteobacteria bacterium]|nr:type II toxin-antitoxin system ParD family antitoxin [Gammaproteobacteria bacterium]